ncbi:MAG: ribonuclease P protein component [Actinomycetota bacterium]
MRAERSLRTRREFERARATGIRTSAPGAAVLVVWRADDDVARLGLAVGARCGGAVERNRIKRRLRAAFEASKPPTGADVAVHARPAASSLEFQELVSMLKRAYERALGGGKA